MLTKFKTLVVLAGLAASGLAMAQELPDVSAAKAAELACHRIERLVVLGRIDEHYLSHFSGMAMVQTEAPNPTDPKFRTTSAVEPGSDGTISSIEILLDSKGRPLNSNLIPGTFPTTPTLWPDRDPVTLAEDGLHFVLENYATIPAVNVYYVAFQSLSIVPGQNTAGEPVAVVDVRASGTDQILRIRLRLDGTFESYEMTSTR